MEEDSEDVSTDLLVKIRKMMFTHIQSPMCRIYNKEYFCFPFCGIGDCGQ